MTAPPNPFSTPEAESFAAPTGKPPWSPRAIGFIGFFFSFLAGGILAGLNYERLGHPEKKIATIAISVVGFVGFMVAVALLPEGSFLDRISNWVNIGVAIGLGQLQKTEYERHVANGGETASPWPVVGICLAAVLVIGGAFVGLFMLGDAMP